MTKLGTWLRWAAGIAILMLAALLCWQCIDICVDAPDAEGPAFTAEIVGERLMTLAVPGLLCVTLLCMTAVAERRDLQEQHRHMLTAANRLRLMKRRTSELPIAAMREERLRLIVQIIAAGVLLGCGGMCLAYLLDGSRFTSWELEAVLRDLLLHTIPWLAVGFTTAYAAGCICDRSRLRECGILQSQMPLPAGSAAVNRPAIPVGLLRAALFGLALAFIVLGVMNGGFYDVLVKAVNICTECIGLG